MFLNKGPIAKSSFIDFGFEHDDAQNLETMFASQDITWGEFSDLTHDMLVMLGVEKLGHRIRIMKAVDKYKSELKSRDNIGQSNVVVAPSNERTIDQAQRDLEDSSSSSPHGTKRNYYEISNPSFDPSTPSDLHMKSDDDSSVPLSSSKSSKTFEDQTPSSSVSYRANQSAGIAVRNSSRGDYPDSSAYPHSSSSSSSHQHGPNSQVNHTKTIMYVTKHQNDIWICKNLHGDWAQPAKTLFSSLNQKQRCEVSLKQVPLTFNLFGQPQDMKAKLAIEGATSVQKHQEPLLYAVALAIATNLPNPVPSDYEAYHLANEIEYLVKANPNIAGLILQNLANVPPGLTLYETMIRRRDAFKNGMPQWAGHESNFYNPKGKVEPGPTYYTCSILPPIGKKFIQYPFLPFYPNKWSINPPSDPSMNSNTRIPNPSPSNPDFAYGNQHQQQSPLPSSSIINGPLNDSSTRDPHVKLEQIVKAETSLQTNFMDQLVKNDPHETPAIQPFTLESQQTHQRYHPAMRGDLSNNIGNQVLFLASPHIHTDFETAKFVFSSIKNYNYQQQVDFIIHGGLQVLEKLISDKGPVCLPSMLALMEFCSNPNTISNDGININSSSSSTASPYSAQSPSNPNLYIADSLPQSLWIAVVNKITDTSSPLEVDHVAYATSLLRKLISTNNSKEPENWIQFLRSQRHLIPRLFELIPVMSELREEEWTQNLVELLSLLDVPKHTITL